MRRWWALGVMAVLSGCGGTTAAPAGGFLAFGDSITAQSFEAPSAWSGPALAAVGLPGFTSAEGYVRLEGALDAHPEATVVGLAFGTNDALRGNSVPAFKTMMKAMVDKVKAAGKTPRLAAIPYGPEPKLAGVPALNGAIAELNAALGLAPGPDLYAYFRAHPEQIGPDGIHPTAEGRLAVQRLWSEFSRP